MPEREGLTRCLTNAVIFKGLRDEAKVRWVDENSVIGVIEGTLRRHAWLEDGTQASFMVDPRDAYVRVTLKSGTDRFVSWQWLAARIEDRLAFIDGMDVILQPWKLS